uniref:putative Ig domain-containing protein n=1 Tax=Stenotrophomonas indicatrix TaxID=2045451 RepID=UPI00196748B8
TIQVQATSVVLNALPTAVIPGQSVSAQPTTNLSGPVTWSLISTPGWLQINRVTGAISGTAVTGQPVIGARVLAERGAIKAETPPFSISLT